MSLMERWKKLMGVKTKLTLPEKEVPAIVVPLDKLPKKITDLVPRHSICEVKYKAATKNIPAQYIVLKNSDKDSRFHEVRFIRK